jgi:protein-tyrosine-phosphatase
MRHVLFIDTRNATRSQIAEAWFNALANESAETRSCGTMPAERIGGRAVQVMQEVNIDIRRKRPHPITQELMNWADMIVILGTGIFPQAFAPTHIWKFEDPTGKSIDDVRRLRDAIRISIESLLFEIQDQKLEFAINQVFPTPLQEAWT